MGRGLWGVNGGMSGEGGRLGRCDWEVSLSRENKVRFFSCDEFKTGFSFNI